MIAALLGDDSELKSLQQLILEKTGGTPFFIEELIKGLFDTGILVRNGHPSRGVSLARLLAIRWAKEGDGSSGSGAGPGSRRDRAGRPTASRSRYRVRGDFLVESRDERIG
jgi:hypothetical protein